jgi:hypothetical protein
VSVLSSSSCRLRALVVVVSTCCCFDSDASQFSAAVSWCTSALCGQTRNSCCIVEIQRLLPAPSTPRSKCSSLLFFIALEVPLEIAAKCSSLLFFAALEVPLEIAAKCSGVLLRADSAACGCMWMDVGFLAFSRGLLAVLSRFSRVLSRISRF